MRRFRGRALAAVGAGPGGPVRRENLRYAPLVGSSGDRGVRVKAGVFRGELDVSGIASHRFSLDELPAAYEAMDARRCVKAVVVPR
jgi:threonine dehydrogenase-like Zn-dependent dehydrogenase